MCWAESARAALQLLPCVGASHVRRGRRPEALCRDSQPDRHLGGQRGRVVSPAPPGVWYRERRGRALWRLCCCFCSVLEWRAGVSSGALCVVLSRRATGRAPMAPYCCHTNDLQRAGGGREWRWWAARGHCVPLMVRVLQCLQRLQCATYAPTRESPGFRV